MQRDISAVAGLQLSHARTTVEPRTRVVQSANGYSARPGAETDTKMVGLLEALSDVVGGKIVAAVGIAVWADALTAAAINVVLVEILLFLRVRGRK